MKVLPLNFQFESSRNVNRNRQYPAVPRLKQDTLSFRGNIIQDTYANLNTIIEKQILPFINESKFIYKALVDIQDSINKVISKFYSEELNLMLRETDYLQPKSNQSLKSYENIVGRAEKYQQNLKNYDRIKTILTGKNYINDDIKSAIQKADVIMTEENPELIKLKPFTSKYDETVKNIEESNQKYTLENDNKELYQRLIDLRENYAARVLYYEFKIPLAEALQLMKHTKGVKNELEKPTKPILDTFKMLEHLNESADRIVEDINNYKQIKDEVRNFILDYKNRENDFPTSIEVTNAYRALTQKCESSVRFHTAKLDEYYEKEHKNFGDIDFAGLDKFLSTQQETVDALSLKKKEIDRKKFLT